MKKIVFVFLCCGLPLTYFTYGQLLNGNNKQKEKVIMQITSSAFKNSGVIPKKYTCEGEDVSPPLSWSNMPKNTKSFALICDDPDAPTDKPFVHWLVYNLPSTMKHLEENASISSIQGALQGKNDFKKMSYGGACPPKGHGLHHYHFTLYALAIKLDLSAGATKEEVLQAMQGHVLGEAELIGTFERS